MRKRQIIIVLTALLFTACGEKTAANIQDSYSVDSKIEEIVDAQPDNNSDEVIAEEEIDAEKTASQEVTIIMAGDMLLHDRVETSCKSDDGTYDYSAIFENLKDEIVSADLAIANQEVIIGGAELGVSGYPAFNAPYEFADELVEVGFDVVCHGTNHALDKGGKGIRNCLDYWANQHSDIGVLGIHDSSEDQNQIYYWQLENGKKIAILNYTYGTNGIELPEDMPYAVDYLKEERLINDLQRAENEADFTIVCPHWGTEYSLQPDSFQKKWVQIFVANGADLIIGTHPHVIEPVEYYLDEGTGNEALVYYSIGNFVNWTSGEGAGVSNRMVGGLAKVKLNIEDKIFIEEYETIPIVSHVTSEKNGVTVYKMEDYTEALAMENEINNQVDDFSLDYCQQLINQIWP